MIEAGRGRSCICAAVLVIVSTLSYGQSAADDGSVDPRLRNPPSVRNYMLGNWDGRRLRLEKKAVAFDLYYISDFLGNPSGGRNQIMTDWGRVRGIVDIDLGTLGGAHALTFHVTGVWQYGTDLGNRYLGTIANPSSLVSAHALRLDSWWFQQALFGKRLFIKGGQFAGQDFYGVQEYGSSYLMEPLGYALGSLFVTTYESFAPAATPAAEIMFLPSKHLYVKSAVLAGNRNPYGEDTTGLSFKIKDSPVVVSEIGYLNGSPDVNSSLPTGKSYPGKYKFGSSYNLGDFVDPVTLVKSARNYLLYFMANQAVYRRQEGSNKGLDVDFAFDWSPDDVNRVNEQITGGLRYNGPMPRREKDTVAFGFVYSKVSDHFNRGYLLHSLPTFGAERAFELNYMVRAQPWLVIQPAVQYYVDLGGDTHRGDAVVAGFRIKVTF
jgi:carbohydrate-selective porin OprB